MALQSKKWVALVAAVTLTATGCSSGDAGEKPESSDATAQSAEQPVLRIKDRGVVAKGGTVYVLKNSDFDSLDPANNYMTDSSEVGRLIYRTLTFIKDTPGEDLSIQPDLAESLGTPSDDGRTWTYRLRDGLKYEDGRPITAQDIKYGVMRSFDTEMFSLGATWMPDLLENETEFESPYATPEKDLTSVETPDDRTLIFHFSGPQPDADWIMSLFYTSPVPKDSDTEQDYGNRPIASGPYKIEQYNRGASLTLVRNENWDPATDGNRPANADRFEFALDVDSAAASQRLLQGTGNDAYAVPFGGILSADNFPKLEDPAIEPRFVNGPGPCIDYLTMNTQKINDPDVRHAIALAIDRQSIVAMHGGELNGTLADSIIPSDISGYVAPDLGFGPAGDPDASKKLLEGKSVPPLHFVIGDDSSAGRKEADQIRTDLEAVGLEVVIEPRPAESVAGILDGDDAPELSFGGWCFDWPTAASIVMPVFGPNEDGTSWGSNNSAKYFDPKYSDQLLELTSSADGPDVNAKRYVEIANEIQTTAWPVLPTLRLNYPEVVGANVTNVGISPLFSEIDLNTLAVRK